MAVSLYENDDRCVFLFSCLPSYPLFCRYLEKPYAYLPHEGVL